MSFTAIILASSRNMNELSSKPKHPKAIQFVQQGLFNGISRFEELESRISFLDTAKERGDAFEVFAEAYLTTQRWFKNVWPLQAVPLKTMRSLSLDPTKDMGVKVELLKQCKDSTLGTF